MALPRYMSPREVAELLSCSYDGALRIMKRAGAKKVGALVRISEDALRCFLDSCPDLGGDLTSIDEQASVAGTPISTATTRTSRSTPTTSVRQTSTCSTLSASAQLKALRRKRAI